MSEIPTIATSAAALAAVRRAVRTEVHRQAKLGIAVPVLKAGEVEWISPAEILARDLNFPMEPSD